MDNSNSYLASYLTPDLPMLQQLLEDNITAGKHMTAKQVWPLVQGKLTKDVAESTFCNSLSANIREGNIKGFVGKRRVGIVRLEDEDGSTSSVFEEQDVDVDALKRSAEGKEAGEDSDDESEDEATSKLSIMVAKNLRIYALDKRNWGLQKFKNDVWHTISYGGRFGEILKSTTKYLLEKNLRTKAEVVELKDLAKLIAETEKVILAELAEKAPHIGMDTRPNEVAA